jgi:predicted ester cyclase
MSADESLRDRRLALVGRHMASENELDFATTLATFDHPRYELIATGQVFDGPDEVSGYYRSSRAAFPDQRNEHVVLTYAEDTVVAEFDLLGTHLGELAGMTPTGRTFRCRTRRRADHRRARLLRPGHHPQPVGADSGRRLTGDSLLTPRT